MREVGQRLGMNPRDRLSGAGLKPPGAAVIKSHGGERSGQRFRVDNTPMGSDPR